MMSLNFQATTIRAHHIKVFLKDHDKQGGSSKFSLKNLCSHLSKIILFSDPSFIFFFFSLVRCCKESHPFWHGWERCPVSSVGVTPSPLCLLSTTPPQSTSSLLLKGKAFNQIINIPSQILSPLPLSPNPCLKKNPMKSYPIPFFWDFILFFFFLESSQQQQQPSGSGSIFFPLGQHIWQHTQRWYLASHPLDS